MIRYIDLFSGIGGFHQGVEKACKDLGIESECVFASDNDFYASKVYMNNYGIDSFYDITQTSTHDLISQKIGSKELTFLFGGFPCQPFSKAGEQQGFNDLTKGNLFWEIKKIIEKHQPLMVLLENVRNLKTHDEGNTWATIKNNLELLGYYVDDFILSPNEISDIPAMRERFYITAYNTRKIKSLNTSGEESMTFKKNKTSIFSKYHENSKLDERFFENGLPMDVDEHRIKVIDMWNDLVKFIKESNKKLVSPLWPVYFDEKVNISFMPIWKQGIINRNRGWYKDNKEIFDKWYNHYYYFYESLNESQKKFEWNAGDDIRDIWEGIIQFRPSGVRVKKPDFIPTLVAINQTPIIGLEKRYLKPNEICKLYGFIDLDFGEQPISQTLKQLGNTVSVDVVAYLIDNMIKKSGLRGYHNE